MGKSTAMKYMAISWADGTADKLKKVQFVFHISLKHVKDNSPIESIIIAQHCGLKANDVTPEKIREILQCKANSAVLLLIDGHDEYKTGCNADIDEAIKKEKLWNCWMIITSRETQQMKDLKGYMDTEVEIRGFNESDVEAYVYKYMENDQKAEKLLKQAGGEAKTFYKSFLSIPMQLNMVCCLFEGDALSLPSSRTELLGRIIQRCINREAIRAKGHKAIRMSMQCLAWKIGLMKLPKLYSS